MERFDEEDQVSIIIDNGEMLCSESEGDEYDSSSTNRFGSGMIKLDEGSSEHEIVAKSFISGLGSIISGVEVVAIHRNWNCDLRKKARFESFRIFSDAMAIKCGGDANIKYAWYGGSFDEILEIVSHGFSRCSKHIESKSHGIGVYLSSGRFPIDCVSSSKMDENGLRHMLLCRVILGRTEAISSGSTQFHPSSDRYDTGVDNVLAPRKYTVWGAFMNSYIQPAYVISFKARPLHHPHGVETKSVNALKPSSPWMSFQTLMSVLSRFLDRTKMGLIEKCHAEFLGNKISRPQMINRVRRIAGDKLLIAVIKKYKREELM